MVLHPLKSPPRDEWRDLVPSHHFDNQPQGSSHFDILFFSRRFQSSIPGQKRTTLLKRKHQCEQVISARPRELFGHFSNAGHHVGAQLSRFKTHVEQGTMRTFQFFDEKDVGHHKRIIETEHGRHESACLDIDQDIRITYQKQQYCPPALVSPGRQSTTFPSIPQLWIPLCSPLREHEKATLRIRGLFRLDTACPARSHAIH